MYKLVIVESPAKCKKIENYLGKGFKCVASFGHIRELSDGIKCIDVNNNFHPTFRVCSDKAKYIKILKANINKATEVILATDDDREGEAIAWHICKQFKLPIKTTKRIIFHEITKPALKRAIENPTFIDLNKVNAQIARQVLDKLVGFTVSPVLWKHINQKSKTGLSAGRCQTPALNLVYENQIEIDKSPGDKVYDTIGLFTEKSLPFKLDKQFKDEDTVVDFLDASVDHKHKFIKMKSRQSIKKQPRPFTTSTLQQKASNILNYSPKQTMSIAQKLYENGHITYMRTDSKTYSADFIKNAKHYIKDHYGKEFILKSVDSLASGAKKSTKKKELAQEAHEAIRPTNINMKEVTNLGSSGERLYKLIWENTIESLMEPAIYESKTFHITAPMESIYKYTVEQIDFEGWQKISGPLTSDPETMRYLCSIPTKQIIPYKKINSNMALKNLKSHYTEARLVQLLEKKGIGRPSTFSSLISKIQDRHYVKKESVPGKKIDVVNYELIDDEITEEKTSKVFGNENNKLVIQPTGRIVIEFLNKYLAELFRYEFTKEMEDDLDKVSNGKKIWYSICEKCNNEMNDQIKNIDASHKEMYKIDDKHTYYIGRYGPVIKYVENGQTKYLKVKKDINPDDIKNNKLTLDEIVYKGPSGTGKNLGKYKGVDVVIKNGKFGHYANYDGKNYSVKSVLVSVSLDDLTIDHIKDILEGKKSSNPNVLFEFNKDMSIRKGKKGEYIFYKKQYMTKPSFHSLKGIEWREYTERGDSGAKELESLIKDKFDLS